MIESLYIAESGMQSQQKLIEVISNNIANSSTPGFKQSNVNFVDLVYKPVDIGNQAESKELVQSGIGVKVHSTSTDFSMGELKQTGNPFDIAINGNGFIEVALEDGSSAYTRAGRLRLDKDGFLSTSSGNKLASNVQIPPDVQSFTITQSGSVLAKFSHENNAIEIGQLDLVSFNNPEAMQLLGDNLFMATDEAGVANYGTANESGFGNILQGFTEMSNVSMTEEMVNLMLAQRGYQLNARIIQVSDQVLETINNLRR